MPGIRDTNWLVFLSLCLAHSKKLVPVETRSLSWLSQVSPGPFMSLNALTILIPPVLGISSFFKRENSVVGRW